MLHILKVTSVVRALLQLYGHAEFTTDAGAYRPTQGVRAAA